MRLAQDRLYQRCGGTGGSALQRLWNLEPVLHGLLRVATFENTEEVPVAICCLLLVPFRLRIYDSAMNITVMF